MAQTYTHSRPIDSGPINEVQWDSKAVPMENLVRAPGFGTGCASDV